MEETYRTRTIILDKKPFREHDAKITAYSFDRGKLELVARGLRKIKSKLAGHLEPIILSDLMVVKGKRFDYVGSAVGKNYFKFLRKDFEKLSAAGRAISIFKKIIKEGEGDEELFNLLVGFLRTLNNYELRTLPTCLSDRQAGRQVTNYELFFNFFVLKLISDLGHKPELYNCVVCKNKIKPKGNRFDFLKGGVVCGNCGKTANASPISDDCIKILRLVVLKENEFEKLTKLKIGDKLNIEFKNIVGSFLTYNMDK
jgi:DNA repair protein RecO (recombination protein O)